MHVHQTFRIFAYKVYVCIVLYLHSTFFSYLKNSISSLQHFKEQNIIIQEKGKKNCSLEEPVFKRK